MRSESSEYVRIATGCFTTVGEFKKLWRDIFKSMHRKFGNNENADYVVDDVLFKVDCDDCEGVS